MKLKLFTVAALLFAMTSCGSKSAKEDNADKEKTEVSASENNDETTDDYTADAADSDEDYDDDGDSSSASSSEVDDMLNQYEKFVDKYISLVKKAAKGDVSAMADYASYMESAEELSDKLDKCAGSMNAAQTKRYMEITTKMTGAAADIAGSASGAAAAMESQINDAMNMMNNLGF